MPSATIVGAVSPAMPRRYENSSTEWPKPEAAGCMDHECMELADDARWWSAWKLRSPGAWVTTRLFSSR
eukprot:227359-Prymnesium_polylepis.1